MLELKRIDYNVKNVGNKCGDIGSCNFGNGKNRLQCKSCGGGYVVTSAPVILELKRVDYNVNHVGEVMW